MASDSNFSRSPGCHGDAGKDRLGLEVELNFWLCPGFDCGFPGAEALKIGDDCAAVGGYTFKAERASFIRDLNARQPLGLAVQDEPHAGGGE
jgi:hypothetical protein